MTTSRTDVHPGPSGRWVADHNGMHGRRRWLASGVMGALLAFGCDSTTPSLPIGGVSVSGTIFTDADDDHLATMLLDQTEVWDIYGTKDRDGNPIRIESCVISPTPTSPPELIMDMDSIRIRSVTTREGASAAGLFDGGGELIGVEAYDPWTQFFVTELLDRASVPPSLVGTASSTQPVSSAPTMTIRLMCERGTPLPYNPKTKVYARLEGLGVVLGPGRARLKSMRGDNAQFQYRLPTHYRYVSPSREDCEKPRWFISALARLARHVGSEEVCRRMLARLPESVGSVALAVACRYILGGEAAERSRRLREAALLCDEFRQAASDGTLSGMVVLSIVSPWGPFERTIEIPPQNPPASVDVVLPVPGDAVLMPPTRLGNSVVASARAGCTPGDELIELVVNPRGESNNVLKDSRPARYGTAVDLSVRGLEICKPYDAVLRRVGGPTTVVIARSSFGGSAPGPLDKVKVTIQPLLDSGDVAFQGTFTIDPVLNEIDFPTAFFGRRRSGGETGWLRMFCQGTDVRLGAPPPQCTGIEFAVPGWQEVKWRNCAGNLPVDRIPGTVHFSLSTRADASGGFYATMAFEPLCSWPAPPTGCGETPCDDINTGPVTAQLPSAAVAFGR